MKDKDKVLEALKNKAVDLENIPLEEVFQNLRCNIEGAYFPRCSGIGLFSRGCFNKEAIYSYCGWFKGFVQDWSDRVTLGEM